VRDFHEEGVGLEQPQPLCDSRRGFRTRVWPFARFRPEFLQIAIANSVDHKSAVLEEREFTGVL
jgi:hypothetical protein